MTTQFITVKRSPAKVCWHVVANSVVICTTERKAEAEVMAKDLARRYCLDYKVG
jgi:hypothetical protein